MQPGDYEAFVREVYVAPVRSVLIVDDDYPTLEELVAGDDGAGGKQEREFVKRWPERREQVLAILKGFHGATPPMIVDVHDGSNVSPAGETETVEHLHQSDLLVLDFELDRRKDGDGGRAIDILRTVLANEQFNLVAVHTIEDLDRVFRQIVIGLLAKLPVMEADALKRARRYITGIEEGGYPTVTTDLADAVQIEHYLHYRLHGADKWDIEDAPDISAFEAIRERANAEGENALRLLLYALNTVERSVEGQFASAAPKNLRWSATEPRWVRCDEGFIAFTKKGEAVHLIDEVVKALVKWHPTPSRLFWAKLRSCLDRAGFAAESKALSSELVLAQWYKRLFDKDGSARDYLVSESVSRHAEMLISEVLPEVRLFASHLVKADEGEDAIKLCKDYFKVDLSDRAVLDRASNEHNAFVCSKPVEGYHLATGHIFQVGSDFWVCLSPMCDLVATQRTYAVVGDALPFTAVKLDLLDSDRPNPQIMSGRVAVVKLNGKLQTFRIGKDSESSSPEWFTFFAARGGHFESNQFDFYRLKAGPEGVPEVEKLRAEVVSQLRYEYALSMMHKLGSTMTRVGLDFIGRARN